MRLSRVTGRWEEAIRVQGQLFALAEELPEKLTIARNAAHRVVFMADGEIVEDSTPHEFFTAPKSNRAKDCLGKILTH